MSDDSDKQFRKSLRLQGYDYAQDGAYFVTICIQHRLCLFGDVIDGVIVPNEAGRMIEHWWRRLAHKFPSVLIDAYMIMPNHVHGILVIGERDASDVINAGGHMGPPLHDEAIDENRNENVEHIVSNISNEPQRVGVDPRVHPHRNTNDTPSLPTIVQWFKTMTTNAYIHGVRDHGWPPFACKLWQRSYYEHVIRNEHELNDTRDYINTNPLRWTTHQ